MPIGDKQKLIAEIVGTVLNEQPQTDKSFHWFINKHIKEHFGEYFGVIEKIFSTLHGNPNKNQNKLTRTLDCDAFFGRHHNFIFEFDEFQHFSSARLKTLELYPSDLKVNFSINDWKNNCRIYNDKADKYRKSKATTDFNFDGGRTAQRAYLDCFRDLLPHQFGLNPTLRINEFEVAGIYSNNKESCIQIEKLLRSKLN